MSAQTSALDELVRIVEPPLRYLATARPKRLAPNALPTARILELIDRAASEQLGNHEALERLRSLFHDFPLDADEARQRSAAAGLHELDALKQARSLPSRTYAATEGDIGPALALLSASAQFLKGVGP